MSWNTIKKLLRQGLKKNLTFQSQKNQNLKHALRTRDNNLFETTEYLLRSFTEIIIDRLAKLIFKPKLSSTIPDPVSIIY